MKDVLAIFVIIFGILFGIWLCLYVMLYGGIMQAINNWGIDNSAVVWGIIRAIFFEMGAIVMWPFIFIGGLILKK